ncbi:MAG: hypothetical protein MO853_08475 [Candidatus Protistobacter heckmanni]|nr:hypothetical protein [Candidatus Protistobacter heckmanni]
MKLAWVMSALLGFPVVPAVYMIITSSASIPALGRVSSLGADISAKLSAPLGRRSGATLSAPS